MPRSAVRGAQSAAAAEHAKRTSIAADRSTTDVASGTAERGAQTGGHRALSAVLVGVPEPRNYFAYYYSSPPYWATQVFSSDNFAAFILYASQTEPAKAYELATCAMVHHYCGLGSAEPIRWKNDGLGMMFTIPSRRCIADGCRRCSTGSGGGICSAGLGHGRIQHGWSTPRLRGSKTFLSCDCCGIPALLQSTQAALKAALYTLPCPRPRNEKQHMRRQ